MMSTQLSPVKQKMKDQLQLSGDEYILIVSGMYPNFKPANPKASRVDTLVACVRTWFKQYGRDKTLAGIDEWVRAISTKKINNKLPADKSKFYQPYLEGIIRNTKNTFVSVAHIAEIEKCVYCGNALSAGVCASCG